jgi:hypothetical protein
VPLYEIDPDSITNGSSLTSFSGPLVPNRQRFCRLLVLASPAWSLVPLRFSLGIDDGNSFFKSPASLAFGAQQARQLAQQLKDPLDRAAKLEMADKYDRFAARATEWMNKTENLQVIVSSPPTAPPR